MNGSPPTSSVAACVVRRAAAGDVPGIAACLRAAFQPFRGDYTPGAFDDTVPAESGVMQRLAETRVYVAISDAGEVVGTLGYERVDSEEAHLRGMAVLPDHQGRSVAQRLLEIVEAELRGEGFSRISLDTTEPLRRAVSFYERNGFRRTGRVSDFFGMPLFEFVKQP